MYGLIIRKTILKYYIVGLSGGTVYKYKLWGQKCGSGKKKLTAVRNCFCNGSSYILSTVLLHLPDMCCKHRHINMTKSIQFSQGSGEITNSRISKKRIMLKCSKFTTWTHRVQCIILLWIWLTGLKNPALHAFGGVVRQKGKMSKPVLPCKETDLISVPFSAMHSRELRLYCAN